MLTHHPPRCPLTKWKENVRPTIGSIDALVRTLNDPTKSRIGNPWNGTYHVSIKATDRSDATTLHQTLQELGVPAQVNGGRYVAIYDVSGLGRLLEIIGVDLEYQRREALDILVRARGPASQLVLNTVWFRHDREGMSFAAIAQRLNEKGVVDGMGGRGWTARKVRKLYQGLIG
jgi:hypothetical protein